MGKINTIELGQNSLYSIWAYFANFDLTSVIKIFFVEYVMVKYSHSLNFGEHLLCQYFLEGTQH